MEILKAVIEAWNREDWDTALQNAAPGFEVDMSRAVGPVSGVLDLAQLRLVLVDFAEHFESARVEPHEFIEAGDLVVVPWTLHVRGRGGIAAAARVAVVWTIRNGAIERFTMYQERQDALEDLGLSEQDAHADS